MSADTKYDKLIRSIVYIAIPALLGFFTWIVIMTFGTQATLEGMKAQYEERGKLQGLMWIKLEDNNQLLQSKANALENNDQHKILLDKIVSMQGQLSYLVRFKIYSKGKQNYKMDIRIIKDTTSKQLALDKSIINKIRNGKY
jgi:hypothetical protein